MLKNLELLGIYEPNGYLKTDKIYQAMCTGVFDLEILINAI